MNKSARIRVIKFKESVTSFEATASTKVSSPRRAERELADRIGGWVSEFRERRRREERANLRIFFGASVPNAA